MTWNQLGYHAKTCGLLDVKGYYTCLAEHMDRMVLIDATPSGLIDLFETYDPPKVDKWFDKKWGCRSLQIQLLSIWGKAQIDRVAI